MLLALVGRRVGKRGGAACEDSLQRSGKKLESGPLQVLRHDVGELELGGDVGHRHFAGDNVLTNEASGGGCQCS